MTRAVAVDRFSFDVFEREIRPPIRDAGVTVLLVEQRLAESLQIAERAYVLQTGRVILSGTAAEVRDNPEVRRAYLGI